MSSGLQALIGVLILVIGGVILLGIVVFLGEKLAQIELRWKKKRLNLRTIIFCLIIGCLVVGTPLLFGGILGVSQTP